MNNKTVDLDGNEQMMKQQLENLIERISNRLKEHAETNKQAQYEQLLQMAEQYKDLGMYASTAIFDMWERIENQPENMAQATRSRLEKALLPPEAEEIEKTMVIVINPDQIKKREEKKDYEW